MQGNEQLPPPSPREENDGEWMSDNDDDDVQDETGTSNRARFPSETEASLPPLPRREEPTLKERLVERERQARVETERARLKRQFALSSNGGHGDDGAHHRENGSVEGTVGEGSSVAAPLTEQGEVYDTDDDRKQLGYVMERFLRGDVEEEEEQVEKPKPEPGVLMERFLAEPVVVERQQETAIAAIDDVHIDQDEDDEAKLPADEIVNSPETNEDEDMDMPLPPPVTSTGPTISRDDSELEATVGSIRSYSTVTNASLAQVGTLDVDVMEESPEMNETEGSRERSDLSSTDEPRVFRLTEAEIQEMAAIEEASIGNAPPSERDDTFSASSLVGDLVGDLGAPRELDPAGDFSAGTTTTALESITTAGEGDGLSDPSATIEIETQSVDVIETASVSSHLVVSPGASSEASMSITAGPPSVTAEMEPSMIGPDGDAVIALPHNDAEGSAVLEMLSFDQIAPDDTNASLECAPSFEDAGGPLDVEAAAATNVVVMNRRSRRGVARMLPEAPETPGADESNDGRKNIQIMLDGFDYDRSTQEALDATPHSRTMDSYNELPGDDPWSPADEMNMSPLNPERTISSNARAAGVPSLPEYPHLERDVIGAEGTQLDVATYGSIEASAQQRVSAPTEVRLSLLDADPEAGLNESLPLVGKREDKGEIHNEHGSPKHRDLKHAVSDVFSSLRSDSATTVEEVNTDSEQYLAFSILKRAFPERFFALLVTLVVEIPVLLMISGGSDRLCMLVGRRRYQLMMGFLPLSSAISGNCGLQASTLTTRAVSHDHVTKSSYMVWLVKEVAAAALLGIGMGVVIGSSAYFLSGHDFAFGLTIFMAQFVSIVTAGLTGTLAPLIFTFIFHRDAALYGGPLETAIQDIVGSFAMVILSYNLLVLFGPMEISPDDICGQQ